ncbi:hypothetical protein Tco_0661323 [Tanacetum coccineum]
MEQYLALTRGNQAPGVVRPAIANNVNFEIKRHFMRELREDTFSGDKNNDTHEHIERVLDIVSIFNTPGVTHGVIMLHVFPITLTGAAKRWFDRISLGTNNTQDLLKNAFSQSTLSPSLLTSPRPTDLYSVYGTSLGFPTDLCELPTRGCVTMVVVDVTSCSSSIMVAITFGFARTVPATFLISKYWPTSSGFHSLGTYLVGFVTQRDGIS